MQFYQSSIRPIKKQHTVKDVISHKGVGLHSGLISEVHILPHDIDQGIEFHIMNDWEYVEKIPASIYYTVDGSFRTELCKNGHQIETVEHLLAALQMSEIDNAIVNIWGKEVPILDGSSKEWMQLIKNSGKKEQNAPRKYIKILSDVIVGNEHAWCKLEPTNNDKFVIDYNLEYDHPLIGQQSLSAEISFNTFSSEIADARTFGFIKDLEDLRSAGLASGATLQNTVVFDKDTVMNSDGLRWDNEPIRHKILDVIGDLSLIRYPVIGKFTGYKSGHRLNQMLVEALVKNLDNWDFCTICE